MICEFEYNGAMCRVYREGRETKVKIAGRMFHITALSIAMRRVVLNRISLASATVESKQKPASKPQLRRKTSNVYPITRVTATGRQKRN